MFQRFILISLSLVASSALAGVPAIFNECAKVTQVQTVPGGNGAFLDKDCKTGYVLPPSTGTITLSAIAGTANLEQCPILQNFTKDIEAQSAQLAALADQINKKTTPPADNGSGGGGLFDGGGSLFPAPSPVDSGGVSDGEIDALNQRMAKLLKVYADTMGSLKEFWQLEGATAAFVFTNDHQKLVAAYQAKNDKLTMNAMPIYNSKFNLIRHIGSQAQLPAAISIGVAGENVAAMPAAQGGANTGVSVPFGGSLSGQLVLSLTGACPFYDAKKKNIPETIAGPKLSAYLTGGVSYDYYLASERSYWAKYNLSNFMRRVQSQESHGGFFSSSTTNKLIIEKKSDDWFQFKSLSDDPRHEFEDSLRATVKAELIDRVWKQIALVTVGGPEQAPGLSTPKANGAEEGAKALQKCPYVYCQVGAAVLTVADAIFGSTNAVSEFISSNDFWSEDNVTETKMFPFTQTVSFSAR